MCQKSLAKINIDTNNYLDSAREECRQIILSGEGIVTICIASICNNGSALVLASDRAVTSPNLSIEFEHPGRKMTPLTDSCMALTAGNALAYTELFDMVRGEIAVLKAPSVEAIISKIKECYQKRRKSEIIERVLIPRGFGSLENFYAAQRQLIQELAFGIQGAIDKYNYGLEILVAGMNGDRARIYGISNPGTSSCFDAIGYHAIGSGLPHAMYTLISRNCNQNMPLDEALLVTYEAKKMAERAPGVGSNKTDICVMHLGKIYLFDEDRMKELDTIYNKWAKNDAAWKDETARLLKEGGIKDGR